MTEPLSPEINDREAWGTFWKQNAGVGSGGCLPERWASIEQAQRGIWHKFTADLSKGATLLDLATGDGRVLRWMRESREDLELTGIDLAPTLPAAPEGTKTRGGIAMEDLPFDDGSFPAIVSQFGFEYGDVTAVATEIARVLAPGGKVGLMVHRGDGPILEHNQARRDAIEWAIVEKRAGTVAQTALAAPNGGPDVAAQVGAALAMLGAQKFGQDSPAWEIPEAIRRAVVAGTQSAEAANMESILATIEAIEAQARNELGRIASLARACGTADDRAGIEAAFSDHGLSLNATEQVSEPTGRALADFLIFS